MTARDIVGPASPTALLLDFDGTLCRTDITAELQRDLGRPGWRQAILALEAAGEGSWTTQQRGLDFLPQDLDILFEHALRHDLDPAARPLVEAAQSSGWTVEVVSDGFGFYLPILLARAGLRVGVRSGDVAMSDGRLRLLAPWTSRGGTRCVGCTTCKLDAVADHHAAGRRVIVVGDGTSDRFAAEAADVVYASQLLAEICRAARIQYRPWHRLQDVLDDLRARGELPATEESAA